MKTTEKDAPVPARATRMERAQSGEWAMATLRALNSDAALGEMSAAGREHALKTLKGLL